MRHVRDDGIVALTNSIRKFSTTGVVDATGIRVQDSQPIYAFRRNNQLYILDGLHRRKVFGELAPNLKVLLTASTILILYQFPVMISKRDINDRELRRLAEGCNDTHDSGATHSTLWERICRVATLATENLEGKQSRQAINWEEIMTQLDGADYTLPSCKKYWTFFNSLGQSPKTIAYIEKMNKEHGADLCFYISRFESKYWRHLSDDQMLALVQKLLVPSSSTPMSEKDCRASMKKSAISNQLDVLIPTLPASHQALLSRALRAGRFDDAKFSDGVDVLEEVVSTALNLSEAALEDKLQVPESAIVGI